MRAAIIYSLIGTCKAAGVDPREWMTDILRKLPIYRQEKRDMKELLPMNWNKNQIRTNLEEIVPT